MGFEPGISNVKNLKDAANALTVGLSQLLEVLVFLCVLILTISMASS